MLNQHNSSNKGTSFQVGGNLSQYRQTSFFSGNTISVVFIGIAIASAAWAVLNLELKVGDIGISIQLKDQGIEETRAE
ncbi:MAG: hypothetical protein HC840_20565 [Leptolyngbyaceae cyanobacterium RM2_2_4]|nr:hypothetical protein [Leptolyngbyaceae cyanobacterium SM1_4_3]NJN59245.1 hypothetical protein [Leptolyngbyaceae cyanobacterium SL_5_9]NJO51433.1 hypothetical protein [Leptolyngbyaceae cyanobacterium RM2_2_4]NJO76014.1 hypothetical protein [Leptolyngbyaceae cyanobacterium RM1_406_9]